MYIQHNNALALPDKLEVLIKDRPIDLYFKDGKQYIEGRKGSAYKLRFTNNGGEWKKIVISVDGVNILTGDEDWTSGYAVRPYQTVTIPGWRKDSNNVAKFVFSSVDRSYNQRTDGHDVNNVGVIGCLVHREKRPLQIQHVYHHHTHWEWPKANVWSTGGAGGTWGGQGGTWSATSGSGSAGGYDASSKICRSNLASTISCSTSSEAAKLAAMHMNFVPDSYVEREIPQQNVGTGYGSNAEFRTADVSIDFETATMAEFTFYYDDADGLKRRGIYVNRMRHQNQPNPFPGRSGVAAPVR